MSKKSKARQEALAQRAAATLPPPLKLDIGCGTKKQPGFLGVDQYAMPGVDKVFDVRKTPWPWKDGSVDEVYCSHFLEHLTGMERIAFMNELWRVLIPGGKAMIVVPHWASHRSYGDPTHQWPPVSEMAFYYWKKEWRLKEAPHTDASVMPGGFTCDFHAMWGYGLRADLNAKNQEAQQFATANYKDAINDTFITARKLPVAEGYVINEQTGELVRSM
jgi:SAM-dependent methyltransferase